MGKHRDLRPQPQPAKWQARILRLEVEDHPLAYASFEG